MRLISQIAAILCLAGLITSQSSADDKLAARQQQFAGEIRPLLERHCFACHGKAKSEADLSLAAYESLPQLLKDRKRWLQVIAKLEGGQMPPEEAETPLAKLDREKLIAWIRGALKDIDCGGPAYPGHVTLRRLTRYEYQNTIRDFVGIDYEPAKDFPADDVGYGFDNIGDVLTLSPLLIEKYLAAAEEIAGNAIDPAGGKSRLDRRIVGKQLAGDGDERGLLSRGLNSDGEARAELEFPQEGEYEIRVMAYGEQAGDEPPKMSLRIDGDEAHLFEVKVRESKAREYVHATRIKAGKHKVGVAFTNDYYQPNDPNPENRDRNLVVGYVHVRGPRDVAASGLPASHQRIVFVRPDGKHTRREATREVVRLLASRAFRRRATDDEIDRLTNLALQMREEGSSYEQGIQLALQAVLVSPHFLLKVEESPPPNSKQPHELNEFELATRLSYFLWSSLPDDELFRSAADGKLRQPDELERQVRRMLADPKSRALAENFAVQWLQLRSLQQRTPDPELFSAFNNDLRTAMRRETELLFDAVVHEDRSAVNLLNADFTFVNEPLAKLYGLEGVSGNEMRRVSLAGTQRGGLLTQASMLTVTSNPNRTSPVKRGKWILENLLNAPPPPPPPNVPELEEGKPGITAATLRQRLEQHRAKAACAACHQRMDPLGLALENFDAIGRWRTEDAGQPIDASGQLPGGEAFRGAGELRELLVKREREFVECLTEKLLVYALGRGLEHYDYCAVQKIVAAAGKDGNKLSRIVLEIATSEPFQKQGAKSAE
jgi:hypothetical protein